MNEHFINELSVYLKAEYPLIFVQTQEETRARRFIEAATKALKQILVAPRKEGQDGQVPELLSSTTQEDTVLLLDCVHRHLDNPHAIRALADFAHSNTRGPKSAVIVTPWIHLPPELERISAICPLPLPSPEELAVLVRSLCPPGTWQFEEKSPDKLVRAAQGLSEAEAARALRKAAILQPKTLEEACDSIYQDKRRSLKRTQVLEDIPRENSFDSVGGLDKLKEWLHTRRDAFSEKARLYGLPAPKGVLLTGIQGCGKSLSAKATASHWHLPLVRLDLSAVFGSQYPEDALKTALRVAEAMAPVVLWIDEIEKGFDREGRDTSSRILGGMVTWLQEKTAEVFVVATANRVAHLPAELPRKGRFDEIFFVDLPDVHERREILELHLQKRGQKTAQFSLDALAKKTQHFTGSELEQAIISAMYAAFSRGAELSDEDLFFALRECVPLYDMFEEEIKALREWARKRARSASTDRKKIDLFANG